MDNKIISEIFNQVHNAWWKKWRDKPLHKDSPEWETIVHEAGEILKKFNHPLAVHLIQDLLDELEDRCSKNGMAEQKMCGRCGKETNHYVEIKRHGSKPETLCSECIKKGL